MFFYTIYRISIYVKHQNVEHLTLGLLQNDKSFKHPDHSSSVNTNQLKYKSLSPAKELWPELRRG